MNEYYKKTESRIRKARDDLAKKLTGKQGNLVLVLNSQPHSSCPHEKSLSLCLNDLILRIGLLNAEPVLNLNPPKTKLFLPMEKYAIKGEERIFNLKSSTLSILEEGDKWNIKKGPINLSILDIVNYETFPQNLPWSLYAEFSRDLDQSLKKTATFFCVGEEVEKYFMSGGRPNTDYAKALGLLGLESKIPEGFRQVGGDEIHLALG
jgi:hypothetical protein